jgi:hypothetical protein
LISIHKSNLFDLWTVYWSGKAIAGVTRPGGFFVGKLVVCYPKLECGHRHLMVQLGVRRLI